MSIGNRLAQTSGALRPAAAALLAAALLGGCSLLGGGKEPVTVYAPDPRVAPDPAWPRVAWQLEVAPPEVSRSTDTQRIAVRPGPDELQVYKGVRWAKPPSEQVEDTVVHALEDSGRIAGVGRVGNGLAADYRLAMDVRRFEADYAGNAAPAATIEVSAKLLHTTDQELVATRTFVQAVPAGGTATAHVAQAFSQALGTIAHDIAGWTLASGEAHARRAPAPSAGSGGR